MYTKVVNVLSTSGNQDITFTPNGSDPSWTPKVAILQWSKISTSLNTFQDGVGRGYGFTDGTNSRCIANVSEDATTSTDVAASQFNNAIIVGHNNSGTITTIDAQASFVQWLENGMRINWSNAPTSAFYIQVLFLGGSDITNAAVGTLMTTTGSSCSVTGMSWQPEFGMFLFRTTTTEGSGSSTTPQQCVGFAKDSSHQWYQLWYEVDAAGSSVAQSFYSHDRTVVQVSGGAITGYSVFGSWNSDGFTLNNTDTYSTSIPIYYLVIKGGQYSVGNNTEPSSTQQQTITTNTDVKAVMVFGLDVATPNSQNMAGMWTSGFGDSALNQGVIVQDELPSSDPTANVSKFDNDQIYLNITANATATSSTTDDEAALYSVSGTGFTLNWTNIGNARPFRYVTFGTTPPQPVTATYTLKHDIRQAFTDINTILYHIESDYPSSFIPLQSYGYGDVTYHIGYSTLVIPVTKTFTLKHDIRQDLTDTNTFIYNTLQLLTDTNTFLYDIKNEIIDTNTLKYDIRQAFTDTNTLIYNINQELIDVNNLLYDIRQEFTDTNTFIYDIEAVLAVIKSLTLLHNIQESLSDTNTLKYNINQEFTDTNSFLYDINEELIDTNTLIYDLRQEFTDTNTFIYDISQVLTDTNTFLYDIKNEILNTNTIKYDVRQDLTDTNTLIYNINQELVNINNLLYDIRQEFTDTNTFIYNIETVLAVIKTLTLLHNISQEFTDTNTILYDIRNETIDINSLLYDIKSDITDTNTFIYNIENQVVDINTLLYDIQSQITDTNTFIYNVRNDFTDTNTIKYSILQDATNTNTLLYNIESQIVDSNTLIHDIRNEFTDTNTFLYNVRTDVTDTNTLKYDIRQALIDTNTFIYNIEIQGGFNARMVSVLSNSGTGTQDITFSASPSWTPKIAIVKFSNSSTSADTFQEHVGQGIGFTDGTNSRCLSTASEDNQARSDAARLQTNNALIAALSSTGTVTTVDAVATFSQWLTNGMQINWTDAPTSPFYIHVLFLGGGDITNFDVGTLSTGTGTGDISVDTLSYQPDFGLFLTGSSITENTGVVSASMSIGAATSSSSQWVQSIYALDNPATMNTNEYYSHSNVAVEHTTTVNGLASFSSFNSNGFTLNVSNGFSSSSPIYYLVIKGGTFAVGNATEIGSQTTQQITTDKDTKAVMMFGLDTGTADSVQAGCMQTIGMGTGSSEQGVEVFDDTDNVADSIVVSRHDTDQIYLNMTSNATATSSTLDDEASLDSVSSTGFTLNWTNVGSALPFRYITFGTSVVKISVTDTNTFLYNILHSVIDTNTLKHDIRNEIIDTNTLIYNVRTDLTDVNTLIYNISNEITNSNTIKYDIISQIVNTNTLIHNIIESITDTNTLLFNIGESLTNTNTIKYDIRESLTDINTIIYDIDGAVGAVVKTLTLLHNIMNETIDANTIRYDIRQELTDSNTLLHNILNEIDKINNFLYDIRTESTDTNTFIYDIRQEFTDVNTLIHDIRESLTDTSTVKYDIINEIIDTNTIIYNITEQITETNTLLYNIRQELTNSGTFKFDVRQILTDINTFIYDIEGVTGVVEKALTLIHNIISQITDTNTIKYDIKQELTDTNTILYDIKQDVIDTNTFLHNIISQITDTNILKYDIKQDLINTNSVLYDIKQDVPKTLTFLYDIISQPIKVNSLLYNIEQEVIDTNTFIYNVRIDASNFNTLLYNIISQPILSSSFLYDIISQPIKTSTMLYHVRQDVSNSNTFIYNIVNEAVKQLNLVYLIMNEISIPYILRYNLELNAVVMLDNRPDKSYLEIVDLIVNILKSNWSI